MAYTYRSPNALSTPAVPVPTESLHRTVTGPTSPLPLSCLPKTRKHPCSSGSPLLLAAAAVQTQLVMYTGLRHGSTQTRETSVRIIHSAGKPYLT
jgi:hypothetical protein